MSQVRSEKGSKTCLAFVMQAHPGREQEEAVFSLGLYWEEIFGGERVVPYQNCPDGFELAVCAGCGVGNCHDWSVLCHLILWDDSVIKKMSWGLWPLWPRSSNRFSRLWYASCSLKMARASTAHKQEPANLVFFFFLKTWKGKRRKYTIKKITWTKYQTNYIMRTHCPHFHMQIQLVFS